MKKRNHKTVKEQLKEVLTTAEYRKAMENIFSYFAYPHLHLAHEAEPNPANTLCGCFAFINTAQGSSYWWNVFHRIYKKQE